MTLAKERKPAYKIKDQTKAPRNSTNDPKNEAKNKIFSSWNFQI